MAKEKLSPDEKFQKTEFDLFDALAAIDRKDYGYYDRLTPEQQKKFVPFMLVHWLSSIKANQDFQQYYLQSTNYYANMHLFNELVGKHPKLQWLMLVAASPGLGVQRHEWIPHIKDKVTKLKEPAKIKDIKEYYKKIYPDVSASDIDMITHTYIENHKKKMYIAEKFPTMKYDDIELLADLITDDEIKDYERQLGN